MKGLFKKEWVLMRREFIALIFVDIVVVGTSLQFMFIEGQDYFSSESQWLQEKLIIVHLAAGVILLYQSLNREMKRPDIWLHSPVPFWRLIGVKGLFLAYVVMLSLLLCGAIIGVSYYIGGGTFPILDGIVLLFSVSVAIVLNSIYIMALGFLFWSIYQVLRSRIGWFSIIITIGVFYVWAFFWGILYFLELFSPIKEMGPIKLTEGLSYLAYHNYIFTGLVPESAILSIGSLLLYVVMIAIYFFAGSVLFEKKVRL